MAGGMSHVFRGMCRKLCCIMHALPSVLLIVMEFSSTSLGKLRFIILLYRNKMINNVTTKQTIINQIL